MASKSDAGRKPVMRGDKRKAEPTTPVANPCGCGCGASAGVKK